MRRMMALAQHASCCPQGGESAPLLQWHITQRCNLRCSHCYQEGYSKDELPFDGLLSVLGQYLELLKSWKGGKQAFGHITVSGGEPFVREDFFDLLDAFHAHKKDFSFSILTNGSLIDSEKAGRLKGLGPRFVQVSIEGSEPTHDSIRGPGSYCRTLEAVRRLKRAGIRVLVSFTAHRANYREFGSVVDAGRALRVDRVWADRLIPSGAGSSLSSSTLTPEETREFFGVMKKSTRRSWLDPLKKTEVSMRRALQFLSSGERPYRCTAGDTLLTVMPDGDLYPCRRMPIAVGNLMKTPLAGLYKDSDLFKRLRDRTRVPLGCEGCLYASLCAGGLKCLSYAMTADPFKADPGCWIKART